MNIAVPSRFACLKVEDDEVLIKKPTTQKKKAEKQELLKNNRDGNKPNNYKQASTGNNGVKKEKKTKVKMQKQWEEWKEKDDELVNGNFEQDLESAILLSKLHFEENKDKYDGKTNVAKKTDKKQKNKKKAISLNQFLNPEKIEEVVEVDEKSAEPKENFFDKVGLDAKVELNKDKLIDERKQRNLIIDDIITSSQYQEKLRIEQEKNEKLETLLLKAKKEISSVKKRNQTLCTMLSTGEMKEKADVIIELERLTLIKNELTDEVARLHCLLEQERSKVAALSIDNKHKDKKHKKHV